MHARYKGRDYVRTLAGAEAKTGSASWPAAGALWAQVVELNPVVGRHWVRLAEARSELGDFGGALAAYGTAQEVGVWLYRDEIEAVFPAEIAYRMATCHVRLGDHESAVRELRRALRLGLRELGRPKSDEHWEPLLADEAVREMLGIIDPAGLTRDEGWRTDLAFLAREIKRRAYAPFREISEPEFDVAVARLAEDVPGLSDIQILAGMMRLLRPLGDGNTYLVQPLLHRLIGSTKINRRGCLFVIIGRGTFSAAQNTATAIERPLLHRLIGSTKINRRGCLFVIIGRGTFSAAQNTATAIERETNAIFVGEPSGSRPNFIGETTPFMLPYSKALVNVADLYWQTSWRWTTGRGSRRNSTRRRLSRRTARTGIRPWKPSSPLASTCQDSDRTSNGRR